MNKIVTLLAESVPISGARRIDVQTHDVDSVVSIHCSASGLGKFVVERSEQIVATLFNSNKNLQVEYQIPFPIRRDLDIVSVLFINRDYCSQDMYGSVQCESDGIRVKG